ncbi:hypothetical protein BDV34DRAFT_151983 [Aspergillus parasiticus]|uniref:Uncharacterized protein n=1 Tax=Aspergillus parasiticus TaxID=5067 RepID=A0A5N6DZS3_ASPPA|nr:hypothetical protein BDV34DRAFT_151983 [Aspergillus parasiticus]
MVSWCTELQTGTGYRVLFICILRLNACHSEELPKTRVCDSAKGKCHRVFSSYILFHPAHFRWRCCRFSSRGGFSPYRNGSGVGDRHHIGTSQGLVRLFIVCTWQIGKLSHSIDRI